MKEQDEGEDEEENGSEAGKSPSLRVRSYDGRFGIREHRFLSAILTHAFYMIGGFSDVQYFDWQEKILAEASNFENESYPSNVSKSLSSLANE